MLDTKKSVIKALRGLRSAGFRFVLISQGSLIKLPKEHREGKRKYVATMGLFWRSRAGRIHNPMTVLYAHRILKHSPQCMPKGRLNTDDKTLRKALGVSKKVLCKFLAAGWEMQPNQTYMDIQMGHNPDLRLSMLDALVVLNIKPENRHKLKGS